MEAILILVRAALAVGLIVALTRLNGLRSFSKMSGFDFAITVAMGSVLAAAVTADRWPGFLTAMGALIALFAVQGAISRIRQTFDPVQKAVDNEPLLLMRDGKILTDNLDRSNVTRDDLIGKLREANALQLSDVRAVVLETTGDVSVLHGDGPVDETLLENVRT